jgi:hypothetical protein
MCSPAKERPPCGVCQPKLSNFHFCRHLVDPEDRLYKNFVVTDKGIGWDHSKTIEALDAYADFLTLKVLEKDYGATLLLPTDIIDEVSGESARQVALLSIQRKLSLRAVSRCGARTSWRPSRTRPAWTGSPAASSSSATPPTPRTRGPGSG